MTAKDFMFADRFYDITDNMLQQAINIININYAGIKSLWSTLRPQVAEQKRLLCYNYLVAWQLMNLYPLNVVGGVSGVGGMPLSSKSIHDIHLTFKDITAQNSILAELTTNVFGIQALTMIQTAPECYILE